MGASPDWTAQGELLGKHLRWQHDDIATDSLGRLQSVSLTTGHVVSYVYDGSNRRVGKKIGGVLQQGFLYRNAIKPVVELDGSGSVVSRFVYGSSALVPDYVIRGGNTYRIFTDQLGSPRVVVDVSSGSIIERIDYDERGNTLNDTNAGFIPFGFAGGIVDRDTALVRFGARDYDPSTGRWLRKEPLGFAGSENFYQYANGDPVNFFDPDGLVAAAIAAPGVLEFLAPAAEAAPLLGPVGLAAIGVITLVGAYEAFCDNAAAPPADFAKNGTPKDAEKLVRKERGPRGIDRIDRPKVTGEQWHAHSGPGEGSPSVNLDGTPKHGDNGWITSAIADFLRSYGWNL